MPTTVRLTGSGKNAVRGSVTDLIETAVVVWSLVGYLVRRFLLHPPRRLERLSRWAQFAHGVHHDTQDDPIHTLLPPMNAAFILMPFLALIYCLIPMRMLAVFVGFS